MKRAALYSLIPVATANLLIVALVIVAVVLYRADALALSSAAYPLPFVVDLPADITKFTSLVPIPADGDQPVLQVLRSSAEG